MSRQEGPRGFEMQGGAPPDAMSFAGRVLSLSTSALVHLGAAPHPESEGDAPALNLPMARQVIDILDMLAEKTRGNLTPEEAKLLEEVLHDLHMRYVAAKGREEPA